MGTHYRILGILLLILNGACLKSQDSSHYALRYLAINVGNVSLNCWESKLCENSPATNLRNYIQTWSPDIIMISEVYKRTQLDSTDEAGPILPSGYSCDCGKSINRNDSLPASWDAADASHEHECIAWKTALFTMVPNSAKSVFGRNDTYGIQNCEYDFTAHSVQLIYKNFDTITPVALHPNSTFPQCRTYEINKYWSEWSQGNKVIIGGDWNTELVSELQVPATFRTIFSQGHYWDLHYSSGDYSQSTFFGSRHLDHVFSNFGEPCTNYGDITGFGNLPYGAALGGYNSHPRADGGSGMDHRQILIDMNIKCALPDPVIIVAHIDSSRTYSCNMQSDEAAVWDFGNNIVFTSSNPSFIDSIAGPHTVKLTLTNACGSKTDSVIVHNTNSNYIHIYPNPAKFFFTLDVKHQLLNKKTVTLEITDLLNNCVLKKLLKLDTNNEQQIDITDLPEGFYVINIIDKTFNVIFNYKLIKQN